MSVFSCENPLDSTDLNVITSDAVWSDESLVDAYFSDLYDQSEWWRHIDRYASSHQARYALWSMSAEGEHRGGCVINSGMGAACSLTSGDDTDHVLQIWEKYDDSMTAWELNRSINEAIDQLEDTEALSDDDREYRLGEAYFMRAHLYFRLAKLYGGVPIIEEVQDVNADFEDLQVARSTEKATYDFVAQDLDSAISYLEDKDYSDKTRITVWAAWALKSRAMLYAASIAENNALLPLPDGDGLVGIDPSEAAGYYALSIEASEKLLPAPYGDGSAPFSLVSGSTVDEYRVIFDEPDDSDEWIFYQTFNGVDKYNASDMLLLPRAENPHTNWACAVNACWEVVQWFDYKDGTLGTRLPDDSGDLDDLLDDGNFYDLTELFENKDPRFRASIGLPGMYLSGAYVWFHDETAEGTEDADVSSSGATQNHILSGICVYKNANTSTPSTVTSTSGDNPVGHLRLAEIYLNYAEASLKLSTGDGLGALNAIRERVDMSLYAELNMDNVMKERKLELFAENHLYFDLKRWRLAEETLTFDDRNHYVNFTLDAQNITYQLRSSEERYVRLFSPEDYYVPIPLTEILNNDILVQNPGY
jgi:hypothetical protein